LQCCTPCQHITWSADDLSTLIDAPACRWLADLPQCPYCQQLSRPHILMFGDWQWVDAARKHNDTALENFLSQSRQMVVIELGAGTEVSTVRHFSERMAQTYQVPLIRINPREPQSMLRDCIGIAMGAQEALQALDEMLLN
jgi:NAD-dependent SIR2 family protein deacetylase